MVELFFFAALFLFAYHALSTSAFLLAIFGSFVMISSAIFYYL